jgi:hypothetical protein
MKLCEKIFERVPSLLQCVETDNGVRIRTTCLYPSFEPIFMYVVKLGDGYVVHDAGETLSVILAHGQTHKLAKKHINAECKKFGLKAAHRRISVTINAIEWLETAIVSVANAATAASHSAVRDIKNKEESNLADAILDIIRDRLPKGSVIKEYSQQGVSGRTYNFDIGVSLGDRLTLIDTVVPHKASVNSKYVAFSDLPMDEGLQKVVAHNNDLQPEDVLLLQNVATLAGPQGIAKLLGVGEQRIEVGDWLH